VRSGGLALIAVLHRTIDPWAHRSATSVRDA
jgi:hypothetical protein